MWSSLLETWTLALTLHISQALIFVEWPSHQWCAVVTLVFRYIYIYIWIWSAYNLNKFVCQCLEIWNLLSINAKSKRPKHTPTTSKSFSLLTRHLAIATNPILKPKQNHKVLYLTIKFNHQVDQKWNKMRPKGLGKQK